MDQINIFEFYESFHFIGHQYFYSKWRICSDLKKIQRKTASVNELLGGKDIALLLPGILNSKDVGFRSKQAILIPKACSFLSQHLPRFEPKSPGIEMASVAYLYLLRQV